MTGGAEPLAVLKVETRTASPDRHDVIGHRRRYDLAALPVHPERIDADRIP